MRQLAPGRTTIIGFALALLAACALLAARPAAAPAAADMLVGIEQNGAMDNPTVRAEALDRMSSLDAQVIRFLLRYDQVAAACDPESKAAPAASDANPCYDWAVPDAVVRDAGQRGMRVVFSIVGVPAWAFRDDLGAVGASPAQYSRFVGRYADFAGAAGTHYSGATANVPRVDYWTIWNEPNSAYYFSPQKQGKKLIAPARYAQLYDAAARRLKAVDPNFSVAAGPLSSASTTKPGTFLAALLPALKKRHSPVDAFAINPYMRAASDPLSGAKGQLPPSRGRLKAPSIGLGNLDDLTNMLDKNSWSRGLPVWITEFAYESQPDPDGITQAEQSQWLADAQYAAWLNPRVKMFIWYALWDDGDGTTAGWQSGLYGSFFSCANQKWCAKPAAAMFRLPIHPSATEAPVGTAITLWGQGRSQPTKTRIYIWEGSDWQVFDNLPDANGAVWLSWTLRATSWFVTCDTTCGPVQQVAVTA